MSYGFPKHLQGKNEGELPFFKVGDISESWKQKQVYLGRAQHYLSAQETKMIRAKPFPKDATVFAKIGAAIALNRRAILSQPSLVDNNVMGLSPNPHLLDARYLFFFVCTLKLDELSRATTVPSVRGSDVSRILLPLPPLPEQHRIVAEVERRLSVIDELEATIDADLKRAERLRQAILKRAFEGKLVPQDPNDEPASVLLERIRAERIVGATGRSSMSQSVVGAHGRVPLHGKKRKPRVSDMQSELFR